MSETKNDDDFALTSPQPFGEESDYWPTPAWVTGALLEIDPPPTAWIIEPSAGDGGIAKVLHAAMKHVFAFEVRPESVGALSSGFCHRWAIRDWLGVEHWELQMEIGTPFSIVANPPYSPASAMLAHVKHMLEVGAQYVACLLPLNFFASQSRAAFHAAHPVTGFYPLARRPRFVGGGGSQDIAWLTWHDKWKGQKVCVIP